MLMLVRALLIGLASAVHPSAPTTNDDSAPQWIDYVGGEGNGAGKRIVLISGDEEYRSEETMPLLGKILAARHGFSCRVCFAVDPETGKINPDNQRNIPGLEALDDADLMIIFTRFRDLPDEQMAHIDRYLKCGKPVIGLRTATHAFDLKSSPTYRRYSWNYDGEDFKQGFGRQVLGETWIAHHGEHGHESTRGVIAPDARNHPITRGLSDGDVWGPTDVYRVRLPLLQGSTPIMLGQLLDGLSPESEPVQGSKNDPMIPVAWARSYRIDGGPEGRVFTTTMGAAVDLAREGTRRMIVNAVYWALDMSDQIPEDGTDVRIVGGFDPSPFAFGGYRHGMHPADFALPNAATSHETHDHD